MILFQLFMTFFVINSFAFGGGYAMIPLIKQQVVTAGFLTEAQVADVVAISEMTPGPFAINSATFAGMKTAGILGGLVSTCGVVLPALFYSVLVAKYYFKFEHNLHVQHTLEGIRPVSVALILYAMTTMALQAFWVAGAAIPFDWIAVVIAGVVFVLMKKWKVSPILCLVLAGVCGMILYSVF